MKKITATVQAGTQVKLAPSKSPDFPEGQLHVVPQNRAVCLHQPVSIHVTDIVTL